MKKLFAPTLLAIVTLLLLSGCRSREDVPYLGRWDGEFVVKRLSGKALINNPKRNNWKGFILLYRTQDGSLGNRCQMHLENEQEAVELKGHWKVQKRQIAVSFNDIKIDDAGGLDMRDPNKSYLESNDLRKAFSTSLPLNIQEGHHQLTSPLVFIGPLVGSYIFTKSSFGR